MTTDQGLFQATEVLLSTACVFISYVKYSWTSSKLAIGFNGRFLFDLASVRYWLSRIAELKKNVTMSS